jgi:hypothetical protein
MKIRPVGTEFNADQQIDMMRLIVAFRNFTSAPNKTGPNQYVSVWVSNWVCSRNLTNPVA